MKNIREKGEKFLMVYVMEVPRQISFFAFATLFNAKEKKTVPSFTINLHPLYVSVILQRLKKFIKLYKLTV